MKSARDVRYVRSSESTPKHLCQMLFSDPVQIIRKKYPPYIWICYTYQWKVARIFRTNLFAHLLFQSFPNRTNFNKLKINSTKKIKKEKIKMSWIVYRLYFIKRSRTAKETVCRRRWKTDYYATASRKRLQSSAHTLSVARDARGRGRLYWTHAINFRSYAPVNRLISLP